MSGTPPDDRSSGSGATISRYYPPVDAGGLGRFAHLHGNRETLLEPVDAESQGQVDFRCAECPDRASIVFEHGTSVAKQEHARRMAEESRRWGRDREAAFWDRAEGDAGA
ncbi:MAG TPA: hypothetical protein VKR30_02890 [Candidatus Limnocylindrales bacterium]|nr:hypothetical protein [Candidatus Limnocylindrales bacterium]